MKLLIVADDFTGACDAAGAFAATRDTLVVLSATDDRSLWEGDRVDVLAVDLDLRECTDPQAQEKTEAVARQLGSTTQHARVFLKIDSTLRGPIAGLVAGALSGSGKSIAVIAPAFPEQRRTLHEGRVVVDGQPGASLTAALGMQGTALLGASFATSAEEVEQAVEHARMRGAKRVLVDADSSECLKNVARAWQRHPDWLLVGSGGLTRQVAGAATPTRPRGVDVSTVRGPILVIAGSPAPVTAAQIDRLVILRRNDEGSASPGSQQEVDPSRAQDDTNLRGISITIVRARAATPLLPPPPHNLLVLCTLPTTERDAGESARAIADTVFEWSKSLLPGALVLAGGATARSVCERLRASGMRVSGEFSPGVPMGRLVGGVWDNVPVVTKAGGFGMPNTLLDVVRALGVLSNQP